MGRTTLDEAARHLRRRDETLATLIARVGACELRPSRNHFLTLVESIVWQQLSWKAALTIHGRMLDAVGSRRPKPADFLRTPAEALRAAGLSRQKCRYVLELAEFFEQNRWRRLRLSQASDAEVIAALTELSGIGRWTAEMFLIFGLNRLDIFPLGDLGLRKAVAHLYLGRKTVSDTRLEKISDRWRPYRTVASLYLWRGFDAVPLARP